MKIERFVGKNNLNLGTVTIFNTKVVVMSQSRLKILSQEILSNKNIGKAFYQTL